MSDSNKAIILRLMNECFNQHTVDILPGFYSQDFVQHTPALGDLCGPEHRELLASTFAAFPDARWTVLDQIAEQDNVVTRWTFTGTHRGTFMGIAPTEKAADLQRHPYRPIRGRENRRGVGRVGHARHDAATGRSPGGDERRRHGRPVASVALSPKSQVQ